MDDYTKANLDWWNKAAIVHSQSQGDIYELASFKAGKTKLLPLELEEVGDVAGKRLLHLQCHFGLDTLSWEPFPDTEKGEDRFMRFKDPQKRDMIPLMFSLKATKTAT